MNEAEVFLFVPFLICVVARHLGLYMVANFSTETHFAKPNAVGDAATTPATPGADTPRTHRKALP